MLSADVAIKAQEPDRIADLIVGWRKAAQAHVLFDSQVSIAIAQTYEMCAKGLEAIVVPHDGAEEVLHAR